MADSFIQFADGYVHPMPDADTADEIVAATLPLIERLEAEHGKATEVRSGRLHMVSPERAAEMHAAGQPTINTAGMEWPDVQKILDEGGPPDG